MILRRDETHKASIIVESELDAVLLEQEAGDFITTIALGSAQARPDVNTNVILKQADIVLVALDADLAGAKQAWHWWAENYPNSKRWPPVNGKDPGDILCKLYVISISYT